MVVLFSLWRVRYSRALAFASLTADVLWTDSGGRKVIAPGIAHAETITTFHSARFMEDPKAIEGNLDGNPLHEYAQ